MPRRRKHKNRYCWKSNLAEPVFLAVLNQWCKGRSAVRAAETINRWGRRRWAKPITRETVSRYFIELGVHLWIVGLSEVHLRGHGEPSSTEALWGVYRDLWAIHDVLTQIYDLKRSREFREAHGRFWSVEAEPAVAVLIRDFTNSYGISRKWLHAYYARAYVIGSAIGQGYSDREAVKILYDAMVAYLGEYPLRKPLPEENLHWVGAWQLGLISDEQAP